MHHKNRIMFLAIVGVFGLRGLEAMLSPKMTRQNELARQAKAHAMAMQEAERKTVALIAQRSKLAVRHNALQAAGPVSAVRTRQPLLAHFKGQDGTGISKTAQQQKIDEREFDHVRFEKTTKKQMINNLHTKLNNSTLRDPEALRKATEEARAARKALPLYKRIFKTNDYRVQDVQVQQLKTLQKLQTEHAALKISKRALLGESEYARSLHSANNLEKEKRILVKEEAQAQSYAKHASAIEAAKLADNALKARQQAKGFAKQQGAIGQESGRLLHEKTANIAKYKAERAEKLSLRGLNDKQSVARKEELAVSMAKSKDRIGRGNAKDVRKEVDAQLASPVRE